VVVKEYDYGKVHPFSFPVLCSDGDIIPLVTMAITIVKRDPRRWRPTTNSSNNNDTKNNHNNHNNNINNINNNSKYNNKKHGNTYAYECCFVSLLSSCNKWLFFLLGLSFWTVLQHARMYFSSQAALLWTSTTQHPSTTTTPSGAETEAEAEAITSSMVERWSANGLPWDQLVQSPQLNSHQKLKKWNHTLSLSTTTTTTTTTTTNSTTAAATTTLTTTSSSNVASLNNRCCQHLTIDPHVPQRSKFAYAFLLGGASESNQKASSNYRAGLFSVVVAAHALRKHGSKADMLLMVQMSARSNATRLPPHEEEVLRKSNIRLIYLPKYSNLQLEVFYSLQLEKFRILQFEEYHRITYLDDDMLPYCSLDYLMELSSSSNHDDHINDYNDKSSQDSSPRLLQDNVVIAYKGEPATGGIFILRPNATDYERLQNIILEKEQRGLAREYPHWDEVEGWGQVIPFDQPWKTTLGQEGHNWTWHGANCDQGLLYYWTKFIQQNVSIIIRNRIEHWGKNNETGASQLMSTDESNALYKYGCQTPPPQVRIARFIAPYNSFFHLSGRSKPWYGSLTKYQSAMAEKKDQTQLMDNKELWFWHLQDALQHIGMKDTVAMDFISENIKEPVVGRAPSFVQMALYLRYKAKNGWKQYEYEHQGQQQNQQHQQQEEGKEENDHRNSTIINTTTIVHSIKSQPDKSPPSIIQDVTNPSPPPKYAYAFLLGGARSNKVGSDYRGGLYSVVAAAHLLRKHGSKADVVLMVQISVNTNHTHLAELEEKILKLVGIKIVYLPKFSSPRFECFYSLMMMKFHILNLTQYRRVMYLDFDVMPRCNMDYLFELSDPSPTELVEDPNRFRLKENVGVAFKSDPANGGIFIMTPNQEDFQHIQRIIHEKEVKALDLPYPHWNKTIGWGHEIQSPDFWR
jgi:alpha-N-acetylglucosamine transferase